MKHTPHHLVMVVNILPYQQNTSVNISEDCKRFLNEVSIPKLDYEDARICEGDLNEVKLLKNLKS